MSKKRFHYNMVTGEIEGDKPKNDPLWDFKQGDYTVTVPPMLMHSDGFVEILELKYIYIDDKPVKLAVKQSSHPDWYTIIAMEGIHCMGSILKSECSDTP